MYTSNMAWDVSMLLLQICHIKIHKVDIRGPYANSSQCNLLCSMDEYGMYGIDSSSTNNGTWLALVRHVSGIPRYPT